MADRLRWRRRGAREDKDTAGAGRQAFLGPGSDYVNHPRYMADPTAGRVFLRRSVATGPQTAFDLSQHGADCDQAEHFYHRRE